MNKNSFLRELSELLKKYNLDKITGFSSLKLSKCLFNILETFYYLPSESKVK